MQILAWWKSLTGKQQGSIITNLVGFGAAFVCAMGGITEARFEAAGGVTAVLAFLNMFLEPITGQSIALTDSGTPCAQSKE